VDFLTADSLPWLAGAQRRVRAALAARRLPHALLLTSAPGLGAEYLANWLTALALCESSNPRPCGACASCLLLRSDSHPDAYAVRLEENAQQIKIDQVRSLIESLVLKSYRGGYKVGVIESAEALNASAANALLKTLEEPTADTLLILIARPAHRLPATIASRCMRLPLSAPSAPAARAWLSDRSPANTAGAHSWDAALALAGGAPLVALELDGTGLAALDADMQESLQHLCAGSVDVTLLAERWIKSDLGLRIAWLENWITRRVYTGLGAAPSHQSAEPVRLPAALLKAKIRSLFELLDAARELRRLASTSMNQQLALEALLLGGRATFSDLLAQLAGTTANCEVQVINRVS
jgi:DNA polymerase-3 subunit delta'